MKRLLLILMTLTLAVQGAKSADTAKEVLDKAVAQLKGAGGVQAKFTLTTLEGKKTRGSTSGTMNVEGGKLSLKTNDLLVWFDGKTQWTMLPGDSEVTESQPTATEKKSLNPYSFLQIYNEGYTTKMKEGKLSNGKQGYKVFLNATRGQDIREVFIEIDTSYNLVRVSFRQGKQNWTRIVINSLATGKTFADDEFVFPSSQYPNVEVINLD